MVGADGHPAGVGWYVLDAIRDRLAQVLAGEVVDIDTFALPGGLVLTPTVFELPDEFFLLGVNRDHWLASGFVLGGLAGSIPAGATACQIPHHATR